MKGIVTACALLVGLSASAGPALAIDVVQSAVIAAPADKVWGAIKDFCSIKEWHPAIAGCDLAAMGDLPKRTLTTGDGGKIVEIETFHSDKTMTSAYKIIESPLPVVEYWSTITVTPKGDGQSEMTWRGRFAAPDGQDKAAEEVITGIYVSGLENIGKQLGQ